MAARADRFMINALIREYTVEAAATVTVGKRVKFGTSDTTVEDCGANENGIGIAVEYHNTVNETAGAAGTRVGIALDGVAIVPVLVGTGGATRGSFAVTVSDGLTNQTIGGGSTLVHIAGKFMQTGVVGDIVGMLVGCTVSSVKA